MNSMILRAENISKNFSQGSSILEILKGVDLDINRNESICIEGSSGSGKSTLLHTLGSLERPTSGSVFFEGEDIYKKSDDELADYRLNKVGFVFQFHHLISEFTALENVTIKGKMLDEKQEQYNQKALTLLDEIGLSHRLNHYPSELSGGELQRVALARAMYNQPDIVFADEPTGNLDQKTSLSIQNLLFELLDNHKTTLVVVTHDSSFAKKFGKSYLLKNGVLQNC